jgi:DNA-binding GntR family transcriptional regulator
MVDGSLSSRVYSDILGRIISGRMKPGDVFNRRQIAAELQVSVAPVLEAMLELESEGLIETLPRRGTRVRMPDAQDVWGHLALREAIECQAARLSCGDHVRRHQMRLERLAGELDALSHGSVEQIRGEIRFHHYLVSLAQCPPLTEAFERVMKVGLLHAAGTMETTPPTGNEHQTLVAALMNSDCDAAEAAMRTHLRAANPTLLNGRPTEEKPFPSLPAWLSE